MVQPEIERGGASYDVEQLLNQYLAHRRAAVTSPNLVMEDPNVHRATAQLAVLPKRRG